MVAGIRQQRWPLPSAQGIIAHTYPLNHADSAI